MEMYYIVTDIPRWLPCERAVRIGNGYMLYEFDPETNVYTDSGYASSLEDLRFIISFRYGIKSELLLVRSFEEVAKMFASRFPRIIHLARGDVFCVRRGDVLFNVKWDYDADGNLFFKKFEWFPAARSQEPSRRRWRNSTNTPRNATYGSYSES